MWQKKMADGQLKIRTEKRFDDEIGKLSDTLNYMAEELVKKRTIKKMILFPLCPMNCELL